MYFVRLYILHRTDYNSVNENAAGTDWLSAEGGCE